VAKLPNRELVLNISNPRLNNRVEIVNTSDTGPDDWIAIDWMELRITTLDHVPAIGYIVRTF